jgi:hypothetical protein
MDSSTRDNDDEEVMIAQEQDAINKPIHLGMLKEIAGTLVLTSKRLMFVCGAEKDESLTHNMKGESTGRKIEDEAENLELDAWGIAGYLFYSEIEDLDKIPPNPKNLYLTLSSITSVSGQKGALGRPTLKVSWKDEKSGAVRSTEFQEVLTGESRKKNLNDWAGVIEQLKAGSLRIQKLPIAPAKSTLEGKIAYVMGDMQEKGSGEIEQEVEEAFKVDLEPDDVEASCKKLVAMGFLDMDESDAAETFYRKRSPIGIDGLSS